MSQLSASYPTIKPSLNLDFARTKTLDPRVTFARASTATFYDGVTVAKAEENQFTNSAIMSGVSGGAVNNGDGTYSFSAATHWVFKTLNVSVNSGVQFTISCDLSGTGTVRLTGLNGGGNAIGTDYPIVLTATPTRYAWTGTNDTTGVNVGLLVRGAAAGTAATVRPEKVQLEFRSAATAYTATTTQPITNYIPALRTAAAGVARFDHNPTTGESLGLLIEEQRANLLTYSEQFDNAVWGNVNATTTSNTTIAPNGTLVADTFTPDTVSTLHFCQNSTLTVSGNTTYTSSFYIKPNGYNWFSIEFLGFQGQYVGCAEYNVSTGTASLNGRVIGSGNVSCSATFAGNGWYRCTLTFTTDTSVGAISTPRVQFLVDIDGNWGNYAGNGTSGFYIWGAQLEAGAFATSYIPTVAASVTRAADNATMTGTNFSSWYRGDEGSWFSDVNNVNQSIDRRPFTVRQDASIYYGHRLGATNLSSLTYRTPTNYDITGAAISVGSVKQSSAYKVNDSAFSTNGVLSGTAAPNILINNPTLYMGNDGIGFAYLNGTIKKIAYYPARLTNAQLQTLTT